MDLRLWLFNLKHEGFWDWLSWLAAWFCWIAGFTLILGAPLIAAALS